MAASVLNAPHFQNEVAAFAYVEARLWPNGPVCPHCGNNDASRIRKLEGKSTRLGLRKCNGCRKPFTVRQKTIFESSHLALHLWLQVVHLMCASKKGISTRQIQRLLNCSMKTAWFLTHRIRLAMQDGTLAPMGGEGEIIEADETYYGKQEGAPQGRFFGGKFKNVVVTLVQRGGGARSFHVEGNTLADLKSVLEANVLKSSMLMTDEWRAYKTIGASFASHQYVKHSADEYVRGNAHTNTVEGYYSVFKRGMRGVYQQCGERHLFRYLAEFDFRYSNREALGINDVARANLALEGMVGKRLTYQTTAH